MSLSLLLVLLGCWGANAYIVEGTVVEVRGGEVVLDHEPVDGLMPAMVMPFEVADPELLGTLEPGHRVVARYELLDGGGQLTKLRITGKGPAPEAALGPEPLQPGEGLPPVTLPGHRGEPVQVGLGQGVPTALTFLYTRCPLPEACPALVARLQALDQALGDHPARIVAVSLDPAHDTPEVLAAYAESQGLGPRWHLVRAEPEQIDTLAMSAGMTVLRDQGEGGNDIVHGLRVLALDERGELKARFDDVRFDLDALTEALGASPR
jgi:protein SCO1/2